MKPNKIFGLLSGGAILTSALIPSGCAADKSSGKQAGKGKPLNIVYIMCDDHSYQTVSAYDDRYIETPNIDRLAQEGARFTNSFVANSLSGPSRACLLTGKHSHKNGFTNNEHGVFDGSQQTVQQLLRDNGYQTAMVGKWHLVSTPTGFDYWDILTGQGDYYNPLFITSAGDTLVRPGYSTNVVTDVALDWLDSRDQEKPFCLFIHHKAPHRTWMPDTCDLDLYNEVVYPLPETFYDNYEGRQGAACQEMSIIKDMNIVYDLKMADPENEIHTPEAPWLEASGRRFYLPDTDNSPKSRFFAVDDQGRKIYTGKMDPDQQAAWDRHYLPLIKEFKAKNLEGKALYEWKYQRYMHDYCRVIHSVDRNVGRVYDYLKEHGLLENTLVIYTSDQGFFMGEHGYFDKRFMYEESFRTPLIARLPDCLKRQAKMPEKSMEVYGPEYGMREGDIDGFVQNIDHAATFLDLAGIEIPDDIQGESYLPLLMGEKPSEVNTRHEGTGWRPALYYHFYEYPAEHAVRRHYGVRSERYSLMHFYNDIDEWELFDLKEDPQQMHNIYGQPGTEEIVEGLRKELVRLQVLYDDPIIEKNGF